MLAVRAAMHAAHGWCKLYIGPPERCGINAATCQQANEAEAICCLLTSLAILDYPQHCIKQLNA